MNNKSILTLAAILAVPMLSLSCTRLADERPGSGDSAEYCDLTVDCHFTKTKAVGQTASSEDAVNNISVFVFRTDDGAKLDASSYSTEISSVTLKCTVGKRKVYVLVNAAKDLTGDIQCEEDLLSQYVNLKDNGTANFFMMGSEETTINGAECKVDVKVSRFVASIRLEKITNLMESAAYRKDGLFKVNRIYLTNVVGRMGLDGSINPSTLESEYWCAKNIAEDNSLLLDDKIDETVNYGENNARTTVHTFYAFPNDCPVVESSDWSQRSTMLVVEATLDGVKYYYSVGVGPLEANKQYVISDFIIRRPGAQNIWECVHKSNASVGIEVVPWGSTVSTTEDL